MSAGGKWRQIAPSHFRADLSEGNSEVRSRILKYRKIIIALSQTILLALTYYLSFLLRFDFNLSAPFPAVFIETLPIVLAIKLATFAYFRLFRGWWRYVGMSDLFDIIKAALTSALLLVGVIYISRGLIGYPRSVFIIDAVLTVVVIGGMRFAVRAYTESAQLQMAQANALIIGAGRAGTAIARELKNNNALGYNLVGFIDDDPAKRGERILGVRVLGKTDDLLRVVNEHEVSQILIAMPLATGKQMQRIINACIECKVDFKTLPALGDVISGSVSVGLLRRVKVEDLLVREPVRLDSAKIRQKFQQRVVLITGAAGSIGSELARQIARFDPEKLVFFDRSETDLHWLDIEFAEKFPKLARVPILGDILDVNLLREVFSTHRPASVFHAAAYKHVPMMERNCFQAVTNNVFGTYNVALIAGQCGVEDFVMISSDKAVNPCNIMGVSKRVAEILILGQQERSTHFVSVRFGNVLGSHGSVVPLFEKQIASRKPVTITHPDVRRYFMTIPEAAQLVLQASTMGKGGEIFVLDMGEPMKIVDLARDLIKLSGLEPETDIPIVFTGLRAGEKLYEELKFDMEGLKPTAHEKIRVLDGGMSDAGRVQAWLDELAAMVSAKNVHGLVTKLKEIVPEYTPSPEILELAKLDRHDGFVAYQQARASLKRD
jgi:FlaA1/EpsC-like NDP-sugar epimerase